MQRATLPRRAFGGFLAGRGFALKLLVIMFSVEFVKGALLVSVLPVYASRTLGLSAYALGWAFALQYVGDNALRAPSGTAIDRWGYRMTLAAGLTASLAGVAALFWLKGAGGLLAGCLLLGAGSSPLWPAVVAGMTEASGDESSGTAMSAVYLASFIGTGGGPIAANWFAGDDNMRLPFALCLALSALAVAASLLLPARLASGANARSGGREGRRTGVLRALRDVKGGALLYPAMFLQTLALGLLTPVVTLYAREELGLRANQFSVLLVVGGAAALALLPVVGKLADKLGTRPFLLAGIPLTAAATAAFALIGKPGPSLYAAVVAVAVGYALLIPSWNAHVAHEIPKERRGSAWGAFLAIEGSGFVVGPVAAGWLWESASRQAPFWASAAALCAFFGLYLFISLRNPDMVP